jgi:hypothetical protein
MVCEADANVVMAEVFPSRCLLISRLLAPASVLVVQDAIKLEAIFSGQHYKSGNIQTYAYALQDELNR